MTEDEIMILLEAIERGDRRRTFDDGDVAFWLDVARHAQWNLDDALHAVTTHYAESKVWIMPADITAGIRARRVTNPWVGTRWV